MLIFVEVCVIVYKNNSDIIQICFAVTANQKFFSFVEMRAFERKAQCALNKYVKSNVLSDVILRHQMRWCGHNELGPENLK